MSAVPAQRLPAEWKDRLDLSLRDIPELYEDPEDAGRGAHGSAIRTALSDLGASAVFCVQGVPTVVIVVLDEYDRQRVVDLHARFWNQGLATLLLVVSGDTIRAFSLVRKPYRDDGGFDERCLVRELDAVANALAVKEFIYGAESGRLWDDYADYFSPSERIDHVLLDNLTASHQALCGQGLSRNAAQALLIQTMFIAYLEDREAVRSEYFQTVSGGLRASFLELLEATDTNAFYGLFRKLRKHFNGDLFVAPCAFDPKEPRPRVTSAQLTTLARFRSGQEEMADGGGQLRFWGYDFKYIPIELVSAVYDRFLGARKSERRKRGAYYTPMFLADTVISALWEALPESTRAKGQFLDPACGSGVFLVRSFQRLCEHWRDTHKARTIRWDSLLAILARLHGRDIDGGAVRVAVFSLYVALLQEVRPPEIRLLIERGKQLPDLWDRTLREQDFFQAPAEELQVDVVIGNPPWSSRREPARSSVKWCAEQDLPAPGNEGAWGFVWKSLRHLREQGVVGFLLPAMGFLHNHAPIAVSARHRLMSDAQILRIVNLADLRFQLFEGAVRPTALMIFRRGNADAPGYRFDYWVPKADLNLKMGRVITLSSVDKGTITSRQVKEDPFVFKRRLWMSEPESKLFGYLAAFPKLGEFIIEYRKVYRSRDSFDDKWVVGNGFQPVNEERLGEEDYRCHWSEIVPKVPYLPIEAFRVLAQEREHLRPFDDGHEGMVRRKGFERGFAGPRVLVPRGIRTSGQRLRASYVDAPLTFEDILLGISAPAEEATRAKLLAAVLNSKLLLWFAFHSTASLGSDRPEVKQAELLRLPFPTPAEVEGDGSSKAASALVSLVNQAMASSSDILSLTPSHEEEFDELDRHCYAYFGLGEDEVALVEDAVDEIIPSIQPHPGASIDLCRPASQTDREAYTHTLVASMSEWFDRGVAIDAILEARNDDLALLHLQLVDGGTAAPYRERDSRAVGEAIGRLGAQLQVRLPGNFQLVPDFRLFTGKSLRLVKPLQRRFWLKSAAIADADALAMELHDALRVGDRT